MEIIYKLSEGTLNNVYVISYENKLMVLKQRKDSFGAYGQNISSEIQVRKILSPKSFQFAEIKETKCSKLLFDLLPLNNHKSDRLYKNYPKILTEIHAVKSEIYGDLDLSSSHTVQIKDKEVYFKQLFKNELNGKFLCAARLQDKYLAWLFKGIDFFIENTPGSCLVHGDFHLGNIIIGKHIYLIDWESARYRVPHFDFIQLSLFDLENNKSRCQSVIKEYCLLNQYNYLNFIKIVDWLEVYWLTRFLNFSEEYSNNPIPQKFSDTAKMKLHLKKQLLAY